MSTEKPSRRYFTTKFHLKKTFFDIILFFYEKTFDIYVEKVYIEYNKKTNRGASDMTNANGV